MFLYPENITIYESEEAITEANLTLGALACVWERPSLPQMEWLFLWSGGIAPLTATNQTWDMEQLVCWEKTTTLHQPIQPLLIHGMIHTRSVYTSILRCIPPNSCGHKEHEYRVVYHCSDGWERAQDELLCGQ